MKPTYWKRLASLAAGVTMALGLSGAASGQEPLEERLQRLEKQNEDLKQRSQQSLTGGIDSALKRELRRERFRRAGDLLPRGRLFAGDISRDELPGVPKHRRADRECSLHHHVQDDAVLRERRVTGRWSRGTEIDPTAIRRHSRQRRCSTFECC